MGGGLKIEWAPLEKLSRLAFTLVRADGVRSLLKLVNQAYEA